MNVREKLVKVYSATNNEIKRMISKAFLNCFDLNEFYDLDGMSRKCFVSKSTITKFCNKMGYSGFKEFSSRLKIERENYRNHFDKNFEKEEFSKFRKYIDQYMDKIDSNEVVIRKFFNSNNNKKINIITSDQTKEYGVLLDFLIKKNKINCEYNLYLSTLFGFDYKTENEIFIVICTGYNIDMLLRTYQHFKDKNQFLIITSYALANNFLDSNNKIIIDFTSESTHFWIRNLIVHYLCIQLVNCIN